MTRSVLTLPLRAVRIGHKVARRLAVPALVGTVVRKVMQRPSAEPARVPDPAPHDPEPVVDPVPLREAAVDLDVDVTLPSELPIRAYDALSADDAIAAIRDVGEVADVRTVLAFEEENAKRDAVLTVLRERLASLDTGAAVGTSGSG